MLQCLPFSNGVALTQGKCITIMTAMGILLFPHHLTCLHHLLDQIYVTPQRVPRNGHAPHV